VVPAVILGPPGNLRVVAVKMAVLYRGAVVDPYVEGEA
jgi:hypothetical protein